MNDYVTQEQFDTKCEEIKKEIKDIKENHLSDVWDALGTIWGHLEQLRRDMWKQAAFIAGIIAVVLAILEVF